MHCVALHDDKEIQYHTVMIVRDACPFFFFPSIPVVMNIIPVELSVVVGIACILYMAPQREPNKIKDPS